MRPGHWGKITTNIENGRHVARCRVRDKDGKRRLVERVGKSPEDASRNLLEHLQSRTTPRSKVAAVSAATELDDLFEIYVADRLRLNKIKEQTAQQYRNIWKLYGRNQIGAWRITEFETKDANGHIESIASTSGARQLQIILKGMFKKAVQLGVLTVNPIREVDMPERVVTPARALTEQQFTQMRQAVRDYAATGRTKPRGQNLAAFIELLAATGARPNEVLAIRWCDVDLLADPPTVTVNGTLIDHGKVRTADGKAVSVHRQDGRKTGPAHTVTLPRFGVEALTALIGATGVDDQAPVLANRTGGWMSLTNLRTQLRAAIKDHEQLTWITPYSFRRTVATVIRDNLGVEAAQQQLSHAHMQTTEQHYNSAGRSDRTRELRWISSLVARPTEHTRIECVGKVLGRESATRANTVATRGVTSISAGSGAA